MSFTAKAAARAVGLPDEAQELLLTAALGDADSASVAWDKWRQKYDLKTLNGDSRRLLPLIGYNLNQLGIKTPESESFAEITRLGWARNQFLFKSIAGVARLFNEHNIEFLLTKGLPLALIHYPTSALRPMNDGDILVRLSKFDFAIELLMNTGWQHALEEIPSAAHHAMPFKNAARQEIDVHRFALGECPFSSEDEEFWLAAVPVTVSGVNALTTCATDLLFMTCVNSVHSPLRWVADATLLIRNNQIEWQRFSEQARRRKLSLVTSSALSYLQKHYAAPIPVDVLESLQKLPVSWLEKSEYYSWEKTDSKHTRMLLRYASYRRIHGAQHPMGLLKYLRLFRTTKTSSF